ncbi:hypothetical protein [Siphonobacter sp. BAB-5405]|uniref:hypothetical protein n=1 Tax=Siphonobacter sp. BAB-5405 TaxID=1864825 RepID=UPI0011AFD1EA|nr:hypothetical protein [Siphonobacter sp. BAB-5405]
MKSFLQITPTHLTKTFLQATTRRITTASLFLIGFTSIQVQAQNNMGIGTASPDASAVLDVVSTNKGVLVPRMLDSERLVIPNPATGLIVYQTNGTAGFYYNAGTPATPSWIKLSSGVVAVADGGTGATTASGARTNLGLGTLATLNSVSSNEITNGTIVNADISNAAGIDGSKIAGNIEGKAVNVTGVVPLDHGGTGQTTQSAALNALLPTQSSNSGKVLQTDGSNATWVTPSTGGGQVFAITTFNPITQIVEQKAIMLTATSGQQPPFIMPASGTCDVIYLEDVSQANQASTECKAELYKNGVATGLAVRVVSATTSNAKTAGSATGSVSYVMGDVLTFGVSSTNTTPNVRMNISMRCR